MESQAEQTKLTRGCFWFRAWLQRDLCDCVVCLVFVVDIMNLLLLIIFDTAKSTDIKII